MLSQGSKEFSRLKTLHEDARKPSDGSQPPVPDKSHPPGLGQTPEVWTSLSSFRKMI